MYLITKFPDISKWKTGNLIYIEKIFYKCSIILLPDISKWNIEKIENKNDILDSFSSSNYESIIDNFEFLSLSSKNFSSNQNSNFSSEENKENKENKDNKENKEIISNEIYKINDFDFKPELNNILDYYEDFYK